MIKHCKPCGRDLTPDNFSTVARTGGLYSYCNDCKRAKQKKWRENNRDLVRQAKRRHDVRHAAFYAAEAQMHKELVSDRYVKQRLCNEGIPAFLVTPPLIAATRARIELNRELKQRRKSA